MRGVRLAILCLLGASGAAFGQNDLRINMLGSPLDANWDANAEFKAFAKEFGAAITSVNLTPPETLGHAGWALNVELGVIHLNGVTPVDADSDGVTDALPADSFYMPTVGSDFQGRTPLLMPSVHLRKGLPFSFELGTRVAWLDKSSIFAGTFEIKWAVNEGFAYLPDVGIRIHGTRAFNTRDLEVGAGGFDVGVGKQFAIGGMVNITPYGGWNLVFVGAKSRLVDFGTTDPGSDPTAAFANSAAYAELPMFENSHNRFYAGARFIGGVVQITAEVSYSAMGNVQRRTVGSGAPASTPLPGVVATNVTLGLDY